MNLLLNIYDPETKKIAKQYTADTIDIMFGTVEDLIDIVDLDNLNNDMEWAKLIVMSMRKIRPLLKEVFVGLTDEELKYTKVTDLIPLFMNIIRFTISEINFMGSGAGKK